MSDIQSYIDNRWELDAVGCGTSSVTPSEKIKFAYRVLKEDFERNQKRVDGKASEIKDAWSEVYQLVGFDNVFQGVWFQGVTQLAAQRGCRFSAIPIFLSVFVSLVTIVGVYLKISKVRKIEKTLHQDRSYSKHLQSFISACEHHGVRSDFVKTARAAERSNDVLEEDFREVLVKSTISRAILLASLTIASVLFAWLLHLIMCGEYV